jgi:hypothetical protein
MTTWLRFQSISAAILVTVSLIFAFIPENWIELYLGFAPDGGNGFAEILFVALPLASGIGLGLNVFASRYHRRFLAVCGAWCVRFLTSD